MNRRPYRQAHDPDDPWEAAVAVGIGAFFLIWISTLPVSG